VASVAAGIEVDFRTASGGEPMQPMAIATASAVYTVGTVRESLPDPLPKPPGRPPGEPIIIKDPPRPPEAPEIDRPPDEEDDPEIKKPPEIVPEKPPPPAPWDRAERPADRALALAR
jgi:hypothetical protein